MVMTRLSSYCIYTIRHSNALLMQAEQGGAHTLTERTTWTTGSQLWAEAKRSGERMPLVLSGADVETGLIYWACIDEITVDTEMASTTCCYSDLRPIVPVRPRSALRLRASGRQLSEDFIRPYALCRTPEFLI
jgi:hypothetical protein